MITQQELSLLLEIDAHIDTLLNIKRSFKDAIRHRRASGEIIESGDYEFDETSGSLIPQIDMHAQVRDTGGVHGKET